MNRILIIAYMFPPLGGSGVQRTLKFVKYLPKYGWEPVIISGINNYYTRDPSLCEEIPSEAEVERIRSFDFLNLYNKMEKFGLHKVASALNKVTSIPDGKWVWGNQVLRRIRKNKDRYRSMDAIYASGPPFTDFRVGKELKDELEAPLVLDYRDGWTTGPMFKNKWLSGLKKPVEKKMEGRCLAAADKVSCLNEKMKSQLLADNLSLATEDIVTIPNGFDNTDFETVGQTKKSLLAESNFKIVYTGSFYGERTPKKFFAALRCLINEKPEVERQTQVHLVGKVKTPYILKTTEKESGLSRIVNLHGYVAHQKSIRFLKEANVLLLIIGQAEGADRIFTGKLFEYLAVKKPILGIVPPAGAAADVIAETQTGLVADHTDVEDIKAKIKELYEGWKKDFKNFKPDERAVSKYEREKLTKRLATVFDQLV